MGSLDLAAAGNEGRLFARYERSPGNLRYIRQFFGSNMHRVEFLSNGINARHDIDVRLTALSRAWRVRKMPVTSRTFSQSIIVSRSWLITGLKGSKPLNHNGKTARSALIIINH